MKKIQKEQIEQTVQSIARQLVRQTEKMCCSYFKHTGNKITDCLLCEQIGKDNKLRVWVEPKKKKRKKRKIDVR